MAYIIDHVEVRKRMKRRQDNEVKLCHKVYDIFNKEPWISRARQTVKAALSAMLHDKGSYLSDAAGKENRLQVWKNHQAPPNRHGVKMLHDLAGTVDAYKHGNVDVPGCLNAADCGDLFRLVGQWVEEHPPNSAMQLAKQAERVGDGLRDGPWQQPEGSPSLMGIRHRENIFDGAKKETKGNVTIDRTPLDVRKQLLLHGQDKHPDQLGVAGRELKRIPSGECDSVLKIDQFFGLRDICSISGTTADVMYAINVFGKKAVNGLEDLDEIYRVLPFGTIAGFHHHSVLEVALPQSLRGYIDYRIGFYTTIVPEKAGDSPLSRSVKNATAEHERYVALNGLHMICFYDKGFPEGGIVLVGPSEVDRFYKSCLSSACALSSKMPMIPIGRLSFRDTLAAIGSMDHSFAGWLKTELSAFDKKKYERALDTGLVRA